MIQTIVDLGSQMKFNTPAQALNKAYRKQRVSRSEIESFKENLRKLFNRISTDESEEHIKNIVADFLKETYYRDTNEINTKGAIDLAIYNGKTSSETVGVVFETKHPSNKVEMVSKRNPNAKALQELMLYYLREAIDKGNHEIKYLIATNVWEWFVFDGVWFEKHVYRNAALCRAYEDWKISGHDTKYFYEHYAAKQLSALLPDATCTYFNLKEIEPLLSDKGRNAGSTLVDLYKMFSPQHLLNKPFANDSNSLNKEFYNELLHIIGLEEAKDGGKKVIRRQPVGSRDEGSLLENTSNAIESRGRLAGAGGRVLSEDELFSVALEHCIIWLNRVLFLKLLEAQIINYHSGNRDKAFLNSRCIENYDDLNELFFDVLAVPVDKRTKSVTKKFGKIPYLNSSLFEPAEIEQHFVFVNSLKARLEMAVYAHTILKEPNGKRSAGKKNTLHYLFSFLDAFDFSSDSKEIIQEENKTIINASVLGLIFEKINGYKDGSFFTPGFITMYMCREAIRKSIVQKFRTSGVKRFERLESFDDVRDAIEYTDRRQRQTANEIVNSLKICDPAVGSGHFLVSALNELIAVKNDLRILNYCDGSRVQGFTIDVENDELIVTNKETDELFEYSVRKGRPDIETQNLQEALFHEKKQLIENCLFGVDVNQKSVMICRLRLWTELLKNAYYTKESSYRHLETLPNIDINIKHGNSLISRFDVKADLKEIFQDDKNTLERYRLAVATYKNSTSKAAKAEMLGLMAAFKQKLVSLFYHNNPLTAKLSKYKGQLVLVENKAAVGNLFEKLSEKDIEQDVKKLKSLIQKTEQELGDLKKDVLYKNSFEWRFEFPEVLDVNGAFLGFDVVIGNPPYGVQLDLVERNYVTTRYTAKDDIYTVFIERGVQVTQKTGIVSLIIPIFWLSSEKYLDTRKYVSHSTQFFSGITLPYDIFTDAYVDTGIFTFCNDKSVNVSQVYEFAPKDSVDFSILRSIQFSTLSQETWASTPEKKIVFDPISRSLTEKLNRFEKKIDDVTESARGILAEQKDYAEKKTNKEFEPVFVGKIDRYSLEDGKKTYVKYGSTLLEKPNSMQIFKGERILIRRIVSRQFRIMATIAEKRFVNKKDIYIFRSLYKRYPNKYLLALINSKLFSFVKTTSVAAAKKDDFTQLTLNDIRQISIPDATATQIDQLQKNVDKILLKKQKSPIADVAGLDEKIDAIVYQLYGLTDEEISIVEGKNK